MLCSLQKTPCGSTGCPEQHLPGDEQCALQGHHRTRTGSGERHALTQLSNNFTCGHVIAQARREDVAIQRTRLSGCPQSTRALPTSHRYLIGEEGYCLTSLQSALSYVELLSRGRLDK